MQEMLMYGRVIDSIKKHDLLSDFDKIIRKHCKATPVIIGSLKQNATLIGPYHDIFS